MSTGMFSGGGAHPKAGALRGEHAIGIIPVAHSNVQRSGIELGFRSSAPPPVEDYDAWLETHSSPRGLHTRRNPITGTRLRRAVILRRNGYNFTEAGRVIGLNGASLKHWLHALPPELAA